MLLNAGRPNQINGQDTYTIATMVQFCASVAMLGLSHSFG
jgi:hypothetical protein